MKQFSIGYILSFSAIMVTIVAALLSFISIQLKPIQDKNEEIEKMKSILASVNIPSNAKDAEEKFNKYIVESYVINVNEEKIEDKEVFEVNMKKELGKILKIKLLRTSISDEKESPFKKSLSKFINFKEKDLNRIKINISKIEEQRELPVYICNKDNKEFYVLPLRGKGLWGPIWGYVSFKTDFNTVYGVTFDHKSETPGLGAEINTKDFQEQFKNKQIFKNQNFVSIQVIKGKALPGDKYSVDAISGGTITSKGLQSMLFDCLSSYKTFLNNKRLNNE